VYGQLDRAFVTNRTPFCVPADTRTEPDSRPPSRASLKDMPEHKTYVDQFARVKRWYDRLKEVNSGKPHDRDTQFYEDDLYAFFMNCYHLKDWIKHDAGLKKTGKAKDVEAAVKSDDYMLVCGGICNGEKHFLPLRPRVQSAHYKLAIPQGTIAIDYEVDTGGKLGAILVFALAQKCLDFWTAYIAKL
jgi:hypothetical protein